MARYAGYARSITPLSTDDNWTLEANAVTETGKIIEVSCGGEGTTSAAACTRWARSSQSSGAATALSVAKIHPNHVTNLLTLASTFATAQPTLDSGDLFAISWNTHGGVIRWLSAPGEEWVLIGHGTNLLAFSCKNTVGSGTSTFGTIWEED